MNLQLRKIYLFIKKIYLNENLIKLSLFFCKMNDHAINHLLVMHLMLVQLFFLVPYFFMFSLTELVFTLTFHVIMDVNEHRVEKKYYNTIFF